MLAGAFGALAALVLAPPAGAADPSPFVTDGPVYALADLGGVTYVGGEFQHVARRSGSAVALHTSGGTGAALRDTAFPEVAGGEVDAVAPDGGGGWYIGGDFTSVGGHAIAGLAHIAAGGAVDTAFQPNPRNNDGSVGVVRTIAVGPAGSADAGTVYVGGSFQRMHNQPDTYVAALTPAGVPLQDWSQTPQPNDAVYALAVLPVTVTVNGATRTQSVVFMGGDFTLPGTPAPPQISSQRLAAAWGVNSDKPGVAQVQETDGQDFGWRPSLSGNVRSLAVGPDTIASATNHAVVYVGGEGSSPLVALHFDLGEDGTNPGADQIFSFSPNLDGTVRALALSTDGATLYAGGDFTHAKTAAAPNTRSHLAAFGAVTNPQCSTCPDGTATAWNPGADAPVRALAVTASGIYAGGDFSQLGGQPRPFLGAVDGTGAVTGWDPAPAGGPVRALGGGGSEVFAAGSFTGLGAVPRANLAAFDGLGDLTPWNPGADGAVHALAGLDTTVYAGGNFLHVGGQPLSHLAALDSNGAPLPGFAPNPDGSVLALSATNAAVYTGGAFTTAGGRSLAHLAALDPATGAALPSWHGQANDLVYALDASCSTVYAGGAFTQAGGVGRDRVAALDPSTGSATAWNPDSDSVVYAVRRFGRTVYAGGRFGVVGAAPRSHIAALSATSGDATGWNPSADLDSVRALAVDSTTIYAGGIFTDVGDAARANLAALDPATGAATAWNPGSDAGVYALSEANGVLHVGGAFASLGGLAQEGFGAFVTGAPADATSAPCALGSHPAPPQRAAAPHARPVLSGFALTHRLFRIGRRHTPAVARAARRHRRRPVGTAFRYRLSEPARVRIGLEVAKVRHCGHRRHRHRCVVYKEVAHLVRMSRAGRNRVPFSGRIGRRALRRGRYRAVAVATDAAGLRSKPRKLSFQVVR